MKRKFIKIVTLILIVVIYFELNRWSPGKYLEYNLSAETKRLNNLPFQAYNKSKISEIEMSLRVDQWGNKYSITRHEANDRQLLEIVSSGANGIYEAIDSVKYNDDISLTIYYINGKYDSHMIVYNIYAYSTNNPFKMILKHCCPK